MKEFELDQLLAPCQTLSQLRGSIENAPQDTQHDAWNKLHPDYPRILPSVEAVPTHLRRADLGYSAECADRLLAEVKGSAIFINIRSRIMALEDALRDELKRRIVLIVDQTQQEFFRAAPLNEGVHDAFPTAVVEMNEAAKCIATDRNTASVFHMMRAIEICVQQLGTTLRVANSTLNKQGKMRDRPWREITNIIKGKISKRPQRTRAQKRKVEAYLAILLKLDDVREAWRNPTMHPGEKRYNSLEAQDIFNRVCSFLRELSATLPRKKAS